MQLLNVRSAGIALTSPPIYFKTTMPELAEVARLVHHLRRTLCNQRIASITFPQEDPIIFLTPKTGLTTAAFADALKGRSVLDARQQGKYFYLVMDSPPHPVMHLGMTGWIRFKGRVGAGTDYRVMQDKKTREKVMVEDGPEADEEAKEEEGQDHADNLEEDASDAENAEWPPRFWKWGITTTSKPPIEAAFVDGRRLGRVRLLDVPAEELRNTTPLKENGPDPVVDEDQMTFEFIKTLANKRKKPIKSLLLDQGVISGIGNWMADEILYHAALHPEQYANTLDDEQLRRLHENIMYVCKTAVGALADSSQYPTDWLMKWRWNKGKREASTLPNGEKIVHLNVGGRTSAIVPSRQKKTGPVAGDIGEGGAGKASVKARGKGKKVKREEAYDDEEVEVTPSNASKKPSRGKKRSKPEVDNDEPAANADDTDEAPAKPPKRGKTSKFPKAKPTTSKAEDVVVNPKQPQKRAKKTGAAAKAAVDDSKQPATRRSRRTSGK